MRTRAEIYGKEAAELLQEVSLYPGIRREQLYGFHPGREDTVKTLLSHLKRQGRIAEAEDGGFYPYGECPRAPDNSMVRAVWVLLDFLDRVEFHLPGDFPVKIVFFSGGVMYEIIHVAEGQEVLVSHVMGRNREDGSRRIVLVDGPGQIPLLDFPGISGFCTAVAALLCSPVITLVACHRINRYNDMRTEKGKGSRTPIFRREPCSGTTIKTWLLYQDMKWNTRRTKIFLINSKEECICPCCGSPLKYRDSRKRVHKVAGGGKEWYLIRRLRCSSDKCGKLHNELPDCICPYKHYDAGLIEDVADGVVSEVDTETEDYPCEGTMKHWRWWLWMNEKNMEGHLRLAAHRFLDLDGKFLKSRASLLEEMKERISPGWLKAAARVIYNSGGRIEPYPSVA